MKTHIVSSELHKVAKLLAAGSYDAWNLHRPTLISRTKSKLPKDEAIAAAEAGSYIEASIYIMQTPREDRTLKWTHAIGDATQKGVKVFEKNIKSAARQFKPDGIRMDWTRGLVAINAKFENPAEEQKARSSILKIPGVMDVHFTFEHTSVGDFRDI